ncbi:hypothetical protein Sjap_011529 [Stephania japonica]|uniref:Uncharacterized protein n=1 Tax=Stephania japonica TaxID=461633 RepID=A0AAP0JDN8_9MAGN
MRKGLNLSPFEKSARLNTAHASKLPKNSYENPFIIEDGEEKGLTTDGMDMQEEDNHNIHFAKPFKRCDSVDEEEYEANEDALDDDSHNVGDGQEDPIEGQMPEVVPIDEEASDDEEANEGSGDEVYSVEEGAKLHAADEEDEADVEGHEEGINGYEHDEDVHDHGEELCEHDEHVDVHVDEQIDDHISEQMDEHMEETHEGAANRVGDQEVQQIYTKEIMKRFNAMQHSMQQALAEMHQTFIWLQRELEKAITTKIVAAQTIDKVDARLLAHGAELRKDILKVVKEGDEANPSERHPKPRNHFSTGFVYAVGSL